MFESQEEAITEGAGQLHKPGDAYENHFLVNVGLGLDTPMPQQSLQLASVLSDRVEIYDASFDKAIQFNVRIASNDTTPATTGDNYGWMYIGSTVTGQR